MINRNIIKIPEQQEIASYLWNSYKPVYKKPTTPISPYISETGAIAVATFSLEAPYCPTLIRIREDDTITLRIILCRLDECDMKKLQSHTISRCMLLKPSPILQGNRMLFGDNIGLLFEKNQLILLYNDKVEGLFDKLITDRERYTEVKSELWAIAGMCATDIKHTNIAFEPNGKISLEVKASNISHAALHKLSTMDSHIYTYKDIKIRVTPSRLIYTVE